MKNIVEKQLSTETIIVQSPGSITSDMDGETVMMSVDNGKYYNLGIVGGFVWKELNNPISINRLISILTNEFEVEVNQCEKEVIPFLEMLLNQNLIMIESDL